MLDRFKSEPSAFWAALGKEIGHIKSDQGSVAGIPIPFAAQLFGTQQAQDMASRGLDWDHLLTNLAVVGKQASFAILFNAIVAMLHRLYLIWDEVKAAGSPVDAVERYIKTDVSVYDDIRTKEIIMCSNAIASTVNLAVCAGGGAISAKLGQPKLSKEFLSHLDIGGLMITIYSLFHDGMYILKVKDDFIKSTINEDFEKRFAEIKRGAPVEA